jgi:acyl carrier protein
MTQEEKIRLIENAIEAENLNQDTVLGDIDVWDSLAKLSIIVMFDNEFNKNIEVETLMSFQTVGDILKEMEV